MKKTIGILILFALFFVGSSVFAGNRSRAIWIEVQKPGEGKTTIAVTENVVRALLESDSDDLNFHAAKGKKNELITRKMMQDLLDGERATIDVEDEDGETAHLYTSDLEVPHHKGGDNNVVFETYKDGKRTFRMSIGDFDIEQSDEDGDSAGFSLNWRKCLPFLKDGGSAIYIQNEKEETTIWLYMD